MFLKEALWIKEVLEKIKLDKNYIVIDIGSRSEEYRCLGQPYIDFYIFKPLRRLGVKIVHIDKKKEDGVDIQVDLEDQNADIILDKIERGDVVICSNLLEHIKDRDIVISRIKKFTKELGVIIITVP